MKSMKGQAALEFMMTYGWAILVVLAAIGALSYFGVLDPSRFTPDTCMGSVGISCDGKPVATDSNITFTISNGVGTNIDLDALTANGKVTLRNVDQCNGTNNVHFCPRGAPDSACPNTITLLDGASTTVFIEGCTGNSDLNVVKGELELAFSNKKSGLPETVIFTFAVKPK